MDIHDEAIAQRIESKEYQSLLREEGWTTRDSRENRSRDM